MYRNCTFFLFILLFTASVSTASAVKLTGQIKAQGLRKPENILIYLTGTPGFTKASQKEFVLDQNNLTFSPHVLVIPQGARVAFPNNDKVDHNVFSLSRTKKFNFGSYKPGESHNVTFDQPGIIELRCDIHAEMMAYILVMKNPYYALTDKKGRFTLDAKGLTPGKYTLRTWHNKMKSQKLALDLGAEEPKAINIKLHRGTPGVLYK